MLAVRIIPTILSKNGHLIKGKKFSADRVIGHAMQAAKIHGMRGVDELILLDISGPDYLMVEDLTEELFVPLTVGGGVKTLDHIRQLLRSGADKVSICTAALKDPDFIRKAAQKFGSQAIVVAIDTDGQRLYGRGMSIERDPVEFAQEMESLGAGEILLTDIHRDGMMEGYNLALVESIAKAVSIPVIASGGCGKYEHMLEAITAGASAVAASAIFAFTSATPKGAADYLRSQGVTVR